MSVSEMSVSDNKYEESSDESDEEPDEDPKLMLLVEAGLVPGLDANLNHLKRRNKKKKKKNKRKRIESETRQPKKSKRELAAMDYVISKIISYLNKPSKFEAYQNCLMMSEWLVNVPPDLNENWIMVPCPPGKRMLVVAASGSTRSFAKSGDFMFYFQSALPGGHVVERDESSKSLTILDCIWHHQNKTYYVLDVLSYNNSHFLNCEANFRFFFLEQKMLELGARLNESESNHYRFSFLPRVHCSKDNLLSLMTNSYILEEFKGIIDGYLFYDQNSQYKSGTSQASGWIKPFMVPDVFGVNVPAELLLERPDNYVSVKQYIDEFETNKKQVIRKEKKLRQKRLGGKPENTEVDNERMEDDVYVKKEKKEIVDSDTEGNDENGENMEESVGTEGIAENEIEVQNSNKVSVVVENPYVQKGD